MHKIVRDLIGIARILNNLDVNWILVGSTAGYLNGLNLSPKDLDILTDEHGAYIIDEQFRRLRFQVIRKMNFSIKKPYASHFGVYKYGDTQVEVMGDLIIFYDDQVFKMDLKTLIMYANFIDVEGTHIPVVPLEWQLVTNILINKKTRVKLIVKKLLEMGYNRDFLELCLRKTPSDVKAKVQELINMT